MANEKHVKILKKVSKNGISGGKIILKKKSRKIEASGDQGILASRSLNDVFATK